MRIRDFVMRYPCGGDGVVQGVSDVRMTRAMGCIAAAGYGVHAAYHLWRREPEDLLWVCHVAAAIVGAGLISRSAPVVGTGTLLLCMGTPLWLFDLSQGGEFFPTSLGTHVLGLAVGLWGIRELGMSRGAWWRAALTVLAVVGVSRVVTPAASNVNVAFVMPPGMERFFPSHGVYLAVMIGISSVYFWVVEALLHRAAGAEKPKEVVP